MCCINAGNVVKIIQTNTTAEVNNYKRVNVGLEEPS